MKFGIRTPSLTKRIAARTSWKRVVRHSMGFKAPRGFGWFTNPKRALYNRVYNRTTVKADNLIIFGIVLIVGFFVAIFSGIAKLFSNKSETNILSAGGGVSSVICPRCNSSMVLRNGPRGQFYGCSRFPHCRGTRNTGVISDHEKVS